MDFPPNRPGGAEPAVESLLCRDKQFCFQQSKSCWCPLTAEALQVLHVQVISCGWDQFDHKSPFFLPVVGFYQHFVFMHAGFQVWLVTCSKNLSVTPPHRCLWSWMSSLWTRTRRCSGRRRPAGSSLRRTWRRKRTAGGSLTWLRCLSAVCWSSERPSRTVFTGKRRSQCTRDGIGPDWAPRLLAGAVLLDLDQKTLPGIAHQVVEQMIISDQIKAEDRANVLRALLLKHRWQEVLQTASCWCLLLLHYRHIRSYNHISVKSISTGPVQYYFDCSVINLF